MRMLPTITDCVSRQDMRIRPAACLAHDISRIHPIWSSGEDAIRHCSPGPTSSAGGPTEPGRPHAGLSSASEGNAQAFASHRAEYHQFEGGMR